MREALRWFGLDWDGESLQSASRPRQEAALDQLEAAGVIYPCSCSRSAVRKAGTPAADGGWRYPGTCRERALPSDGWRECDEALRLRLEPGRLTPQDEGGEDLSQDPFIEMGDPILRRRDGSLAYHLAVVVDDAAEGIDRVVRGRDLAASTAIHVSLQRLLGLTTPTYRHHLLLLEETGDKLAKLHGAVAWRELSAHMSPEHLCGFLAHTAGFGGDGGETTPAALLATFEWERVTRADEVVAWTGDRLVQKAKPGP